MTAFVWLLQMHIPNPVRRHPTSAFEPHSRTPEKAIDDTVLSQYFTARLIHNYYLKLDVEDYKSTQLTIANGNIHICCYQAFKNLQSHDHGPAYVQ